MSKPFKGVNHHNDPIVLDTPYPVLEIKPDCIHLKEDGAIDDQPSFAISGNNTTVEVTIIGQITLKMLNKGLEDIGYKIVKL